MADHENSIISFVRRSGDRHVVVILNLTPMPREHYRIGVPTSGWYECLLSSDDQAWGGSGVSAFAGVATQPNTFHGYAQSIDITLPPLGALVLSPTLP